VADPLAHEKPHPLYSDRSADGTVRAGNQVARKSGIYSAAVKRGEVPTELRLSVDEFRAGLISDRGGASELTTIEAGYITRLCDIEVCCRLLQNDLVTRGMFTAKGRVRSSYDKFLATIDRWDRLARAGLDRRARHVPSLQEFLEQRIEDATGPNT
jgi:hypothetical protein